MIPELSSSKMPPQYSSEKMDVWSGTPSLLWSSIIVILYLVQSNNKIVDKLQRVFGHLRVVDYWVATIATVSSLAIIKYMIVMSTFCNGPPQPYTFH